MVKVMIDRFRLVHGIAVVLACLMWAAPPTPLFAQTPTQADGAVGIASPVATQSPVSTESITRDDDSKAPLTRLMEWLATNLLTLVAITAAIVGLFQYFKDRRETRHQRMAENVRAAEERQADRDRQAEQRFQFLSSAMGSDSTTEQIAAVVSLRSFLDSQHQRFHQQVFDFIVALLRTQPDPNYAEAIRAGVNEVEVGERPSGLAFALNQSLADAFAQACRLVSQGDQDSVRRPDARRISLSHALLQRGDFSRALLSGSDLVRTQFEECELIGTDLIGSWLIGSTVEDSNLSQADLSHARMDWASFERCEGEKPVFRSARLKGVRFEKCNLQAADFTEARGDNPTFDQSELQRGDFYYATFNRAGFYRSNLRGAEFQGARLRQCSFWDCDLTGVDFMGAVLEGADFTRTNLSGVNLLVASDLDGAQFNDVTGVSLEGFQQIASQWMISYPGMPDEPAL
jgi:uncharacterized protein YjbI with pentapeptide repeats